MGIKTRTNIIARSWILFFVKKWREFVRFFCEHETESVLVPEELATNKTGVMEETFKTVLTGNIRPEKPPCSMLEVYDVKNSAIVGGNRYVIILWSIKSTA